MDSPRPIPPEHLARIERHFHAVIRGRIQGMRPPPDIELPRLQEPLPRSEERPAWFPVPGMYGGFAYWIEDRAGVPALISSSWCRVVGGSGQRHEITEDGARLVEEGFV